MWSFSNYLCEKFGASADYILKGVNPSIALSSGIDKEALDDHIVIGQQTKYPLVKIKYLDIKASCGPGYSNEDYPDAFTQTFTVEFLRANGLPIDGKGLILMHACGDYQGYEEKFDRFEKEFMFAWEEPLALQRVFYKRFSIYAEEKDYNDPIIIITLSPIPGEFDEPLNCNSIYWLLDDNIFSGFKTKKHYESEFNTITNTLNLDQLKQLLNANNIEFKYCGVEYKFTEKDKNSFRYVYRRYLDEKDVKNPKHND